MRVGITALFLAITSTAFADDSLVSIGDQKYLTGTFTGGKIQYLKYPTLGCPTIAKAGSTGSALVKLGDGGSTSSFSLTISPNSETGASYSLPVLSVSFDATTGIYTLTYQVPADVPEDTFDLKVSVPALSVTDLQYNCFKVVKEESSSYRFIVISDSHFNTPTGFWSPGNYNTGNYNAYSIITQMKKEIRALNPTFVLLSGDLMFGLDYTYEYDNVWAIWKDAGFPIFMAPGNHDGYASIKDRWFLGLTSPKRDGLDYWRKYLGPCYYSFKFGGVHFQCINSMDGTAERRDGFLIVIENYGGDLLPDQMNWITSDLAGVTGQVIPFMHHNPMGGYRPNGTFGMTDWVINRIIEWITTGNFDDYSQQWNTEATGKFLLEKYATQPLVFVGHSHVDTIRVHNNTKYKHVTSSGASTDDYWGYCPVKVENSQVVEFTYTDDDKYQSIPTGNLHVTYTDKDGEEQAAVVKSGLVKAYEVTLEFVMPPAPWYEATNGTMVQFAPIDSTKTKVWVKATTPVATGIQQPVSATVKVKTSQNPPATAVAGNVETNGSTGGGSGGGGACGLVGLEAALLLGWLLRRRLARR